MQPIAYEELKPEPDDLLFFVDDTSGAVLQSDGVVSISGIHLVSCKP
jgi:hypothetical protein